MYYNDKSIEKINADHNAIYAEVKAGHFEEAATLMQRHLQYDMAYALKAYGTHQAHTRQP